MPNPNVSNIGAYLAPKLALAPQSSVAATITTGPGIDRDGYNSCVLSMSSGASTGSPTGQSHTCKLQDSADNSTFADYKPDGVNVATTPAITADNTLAKVNVDLAMARRYVKAVPTLAFTGGTSPAQLVSAQVTLGGAVNKPTP